jgi:hypothetical protein
VEEYPAWKPPNEFKVEAACRQAIRLVHRIGSSVAKNIPCGEAAGNKPSRLNGGEAGEKWLEEKDEEKDEETDGATGGRCGR